MILLWIPAGFVALLALMALAGLLLPREHVSRRSARFRAPPEEVYGAVADVAGQPAWNREMKAVERLPDRDGRPAWRIATRHGRPFAMVVLEEDPPRRHVGRIDDPSLPFGGTWTWEFEADHGGCRATLAEEGFVRNPLFRFLARFVVGHHATQDRWLVLLGRKFGEEVVPGPAV